MKSYLYKYIKIEKYRESFFGGANEHFPIAKQKGKNAKINSLAKL